MPVAPLMEPDTMTQAEPTGPKIDTIRRVTIERVEDGKSSTRGYIRAGVRYPIGEDEEKTIGVLMIPMEYTLVVRAAHRDEVTVAVTVQGGRVIRVEREPTPYSGVTDWLELVGARCLNGKGTVMKYILPTGALLLVEKLARGGVETYLQATRDDSTEKMFAALDAAAGREPVSSAAVLEDGHAFEIPERSSTAHTEGQNP